MSFLWQLYETYQANLGSVNQFGRKRNGKVYTLLPISHTTQVAHIEVEVTEEGEFHWAYVITNKEDANTVIPCTENSESRSSNIAPHPLHDKLSYVAGDFVDYMRDSNLKAKEKDHFPVYLEQLKAWASSPHSSDKVKSIYRYVSQKRLVRDLIKTGVLHVNDQNELIKSWGRGKGKPLIFEVLSKGRQQLDAFVRFNVRSSDHLKVWEDVEIQTDFMQHYEARLHANRKHDLCYITGEKMLISEKHPRTIRRAGDSTKLISSNDDEGFTYRGRFVIPDQVASISYDVSQKAHNALKWLIQKQAKVIGSRVFLVWGNGELHPVPDMLDDSLSALFDLGEKSSTKQTQQQTYTFSQFAHRVAKAIDGWKSDLSMNDKVNILVLDSANATYQGRLAVVYYRSLHSADYLQRLQKWHTDCYWLHRYGKVNYSGAPSARDIAYAVYGQIAEEDGKKKEIKQLLERLLPCVLDGQKIPLDIVKRATYRASNPIAFKDKENWEWEKTLSVACALINRQEGFDVPLDRKNTDRSYLFGRLLALADNLERRALRKDENRATNAIRYMNAFRQHPESTWQVIQAALQPYQMKLGVKARYYEQQINEVASQFTFEEFSNKPLSGKFLLGYYSQRHELETYKQEGKANESK